MISLIEKELVRAREKFPNNELLMAALTEEVGELAKALLSEPWKNVVAEAVQVAAMAIRIAEEGDSTFADYRDRQELDSPPPLGSLLPLPGKKERKKKREPSEWGRSFADWFRTLLPDRVQARLKNGWRDSWALVFDDCVNIDKRDDVELAKVCEFARSDSFWSRNVFSPCKLRERHKASGLLFYDYLLTQMKTSQNGAPAELRLR